MSMKSESSITYETLELRREMLRRMMERRAEQRMPAVSPSDAAIANPTMDYYMPKVEAFQRFAREAGEQLTGTSGDAHYSDRTVVDGLANFLKVVCELTVKRLNSRSKA